MKQKKKITEFSPIVIILLIAFVIGGFMYYQKQNKSYTTSQQTVQSVLDSSPSPSSPQITWKTYLNSKYRYSIDHPYSENYKESIDNGYGHTDFNGGCFNIYTIPQDVSIPERLHLSKTQLSELESLQEGATKTYSIPDVIQEKGFTYQETYKKLPSKSISNTTWSSFEFTNNWESYGINNMYFVNRNSYLYLIKMNSHIPCGEEPVQMLSTFKFTN